VNPKPVPTKKIPKVTKPVPSSIPTKPLNSFFVDENLKQNLLQRSYETLRTLSPEEGLIKKFTLNKNRFSSQNYSKESKRISSFISIG
jgi:hypothetical protein